jgi:hypothetical protein
MPSTYKIIDTVNWIGPFLSGFPLVNANTIEPARTIANTILTAFYSAPFVWEHNRSTCTFTCAGNAAGGAQTDYPLTQANFGFIESAYLTVPAGYSGDTVGKIYQLPLQRSLEKSWDPDRPQFISIFTDNGSGSLVFRVQNAPDANYPVVLTIQQMTSLITNLNSFWPMPDKYIHIVNYGFMALAMLYANDGRWQQMNVKFVAHLLGAQSGLDENQKNIFLASWAQLTQQVIAIGPKTNQGYASRGQ